MKRLVLTLLLVGMVAAPATAALMLLGDVAEGVRLEGAGRRQAEEQGGNLTGGGGRLTDNLVQRRIP